MYREPLSGQSAHRARQSGFTNDQMTWFLAIAHAVEHILSAALPPLFILIKQNLGLSYTQVGLLSTARSTTAGLVQAPVGVLVDKTGARKPLAIGFMLVSVALLLSGLAPTFTVLLLVQVLSGFGSSAFHPATYALVTRLANGSRIGKKMAFHTFGGFLGTTVSFLLVAFLGVRLGWRNALIALSIPGFMIAYLFWRLFDIPAQSQAGKKSEARGTAMPALPVVALVGITTIHGMFARGLSAFLPVFLSAVYGMSVQQAGLFATLMTGTGCLGLLGGGVLADRFPKTRVIAIASVGMCITSLVIANTTLTPLALAVVLVLSGLAQYGSGPSQTAMISEFGQGSSQGSLFGLTFAGSFLGGSMVTVIAGWMADTLGVRSIFVFLAFLALVRAAMTVPLGNLMGVRMPEKGSLEISSG